MTWPCLLSLVIALFMTWNNLLQSKSMNLSLCQKKNQKFILQLLNIDRTECAFSWQNLNVNWHSWHLFLYNKVLVSLCSSSMFPQVFWGGPSHHSSRLAVLLHSPVPHLSDARVAGTRNGARSCSTHRSGWASTKTHHSSGNLSVLLLSHRLKVWNRV